MYGTSRSHCPLITRRQSAEREVGGSCFSCGPWVGVNRSRVAALEVRAVDQDAVNADLAHFGKGDFLGEKTDLAKPRPLQERSDMRARASGREDHWLEGFIERLSEIIQDVTGKK